MNHQDDGVVASVLYSLVNVFDEIPNLTSLIRRLAHGDERDTGEMPIQSMAIILLAQTANDDIAALGELLQIAQDTATAEVPRKQAWQCLADIYGVEWLLQYSEELIIDPESSRSEEIRNIIRNAM